MTEQTPTWTEYATSRTEGATGWRRDAAEMLICLLGFAEMRQSIIVASTPHVITFIVYADRGNEACEFTITVESEGIYYTRASMHRPRMECATSWRYGPLNAPKAVELLQLDIDADVYE